MRKYNKRLNIPAVLVHQVGDTKYEVEGMITSINESTNTCSMKFKGYSIQNGIPMDSVYLNEAFLDKIKDYGRKALDTVKSIIRKVKGFLFPVNEDGDVEYQYINTPINMTIAANKGLLSPAIKFFPSQGMIDVASKNGVRLNSGDLDTTMESDVKEIETYWKRVMKQYVKDEDSTVSEAVHYVNENYYRPNKALKHINETPVITLHNPVNGQYGQEVDAKELQSLLVSNIVKQITPREDGSSSKEKPLLIWGAPGIGKTAIIKQAINDIRDIYGIDLDTVYLVLGQMFREDFVLPDTVTNIAGEQNAIDVPKSWLPTYYPSPDPRVRAQQDEYYNSGLYKYRATDLKLDDGTELEPHKYYGGVIFMDEFSRMNSTVGSIVMNLVNDKVYQNMVLGSRWGFVLAANRAIDMLELETDAASRWEPAKADRYISIIYVPKKSDWLEWARQKKAVGPNGEVRQNVDEMICSFIESASDGVWYDALDLGSRDYQMNQKERTAIQSGDISQVETVLLDSDTLGLDKTTWTPRDWSEKISDSILGELKIIFMGRPELYNSIFVDGNISQPKLEKALDELPEKAWNIWANRNRFLGDVNGSRIMLFRKWIDQHIITSMGGDETLPSTEWIKYNEWDNTFSTKVIDSIWKNHTLGDKRLMADDDKYFNTIIQYQTTNTSKWKSKTLTINNVFKKIIDNFPGGSENFTKLANENFANAFEEPQKFIIKDYLSDHTMADVNKTIDELTEYFSFNLGTKKEYLLRQPGPFNIKNKNDAYIAQCLSVFTASELPRMIANVILYAVKVMLQSNVDSVLDLVYRPLFYELNKKLYKGTAPGMLDHDMSLSAFNGNVAALKKLPYKLFTDAPETFALASSVIGIASILYSNATLIKKTGAATDGKI